MKTAKLARLRVETLEDSVATSLKSGVKIRTASFEQWGDRNRITPGLRGQWLSKTGKPLDFIAHNVVKADNQFAGYDEQDVIERIVAFVSEYDTRAKFDGYVSRRLKEQQADAGYRKAAKTSLKQNDVECLVDHALEVMSREQLARETDTFLKSPSAYFGKLLDVEACRVDLFTLPEGKQVEVVKAMQRAAQPKKDAAVTKPLRQPTAPAPLSSKPGKHHKSSSQSSMNRDIRTYRIASLRKESIDTPPAGLSKPLFELGERIEGVRWSGGELINRNRMVMGISWSGQLRQYVYDLAADEDLDCTTFGHAEKNLVKKKKTKKQPMLAKAKKSANAARKANAIAKKQTVSTNSKTTDTMKKGTTKPRAKAAGKKTSTKPGRKPDTRKITSPKVKARNKKFAQIQPGVMNEFYQAGKKGQPKPAVKATYKKVARSLGLRSRCRRPGHLVFRKPPGKSPRKFARNGASSEPHPQRV